jgi:hypothetical protein
MMKFFQNIYSKANEPGRTPEPRHSLDTTPLSPDTAGDTGGTITTDTPSSLAGDHTDGFNKLSGWATTFGLQPNTVVNDDGTVDVKYYDPEDNGWGAFGYNTRDPKLVGGSLPVDVLTQSIGDYIHDPAIIRQIKNGDYKIAVTNANGQTEIVPIVDAGPANWTGNLVDLTWAAQKKLGLSGKDQVDVQLIGPAGATIPIKGFNPGTVARQAGETRHGTAFTKEREAETEEPEKTEEQKYAEEHSSYPAANVLTNEQRAALLAKLSPDEQATIRTWDSMSPEDQAKRSASDPAWAQKLHDIAIHLNSLRGRTAPPAPTKMTNVILPSGGAPPKTEQPKEGTKAHLLSTLEKAQKALAQGTNRLDEVQ